MTGKTASRLEELGIVLPVLPISGGNYVPAKRVGQMVYLAGVVSSSPAGVITGTICWSRCLVRLAGMCGPRLASRHCRATHWSKCR